MGQRQRFTKEFKREAVQLLKPGSKVGSESTYPFGRLPVSYYSEAEGGVKPLPYTLLCVKG
jgi:hypothetical protein